MLGFFSMPYTNLIKVNINRPPLLVSCLTLTAVRILQGGFLCREKSEEKPREAGLSADWKVPGVDGCHRQPLHSAAETGG